ncbi:sensor histidine kinase [Paenibacillus lemnae]|nr:histidine kinase [Paenibacillus lemnae]
MRFKYKLLVILLSMLAILVSLNFGSLYFTYSVYDKQLYEKSSLYLNMSSRAVDMELKKLESMSLNIVSDKQIQESLKELADGDIPDYAAYLYRNTMMDRLWSHISVSVPYVQSAHIADLTGREVRYGDTVAFSEEKYDRVREESVTGEGAMRWLNPDEADPMLIMVRQIRAYEPLTLEPIGILYLRIDIERLIKDYAGRNDDNGIIVLKSENETVFPARRVDYSFTAQLNSLAPGASYEVMNTTEGEAYFVSRAQSAYTGWMYYHALPYDVIFNTIHWLKRSLILLFSAVVILVAAAGMKLARGMTRPIESLIKQMKDVHDLESMDQSLNTRTEVQMDEVGLLHRTYRLMLARINMLIKENYAKQLVIHETEFKALQAQMNPHFLYNTLESINWLAKKNKQDQISRMVISLGYLLRSSISLKDDVITLREELQIVEHYVIIQKYRFRDRLNFSADIPERWLHTKVPKLTLQPLLENAVLYGLETMVNSCSIRIYMEEEDERLVVIVEDNGPGMSEEFLQRMMKGEVKTRGTGIGLMNIRDRIKLTFGEQYGIEVESTSGVGTKVRVLIPYTMEDEP